MLRISRENLAGVAVVRVEGRLYGEGADELERECRDVGGSLRLDLTALLTADEVGLALLRSLRDSGAVFVGASPFIQLLLEGSKKSSGGGNAA